MQKSQRMRIALDMTMTLLSIALMGGTMLFPDERVHQVLGMALLVMWAAHTALHRRWYASLLRGKYPPYRVMQIAVNAGISVCAALLAASGMMMAWFMPVSRGLEFARMAHLASSHWYYLFMCAHLGMHLSQMFSRLWNRLGAAAMLALRIFLAAVCAYGTYASALRGVWKYLFLRQQFFFLDLGRGYVLFAVDYVAMLVLFAAAAHYAGKILLRRKRGSE